MCLTPNMNVYKKMYTNIICQFLIFISHICPMQSALFAGIYMFVKISVDSYGFAQLGGYSSVISLIFCLLFSFFKIEILKNNSNPLQHKLTQSDMRCVICTHIFVHKLTFDVRLTSNMNVCIKKCIQISFAI
jgi:hypothetical protein